MRFHQACNYSSFLGIYSLLRLMILPSLLISGVQSFAPFSVANTVSSSISPSGIRDFQPTDPSLADRRRRRRRRPASSLNCICINCKYVTSCEAYHFVEEKHEQPHMTENPTFEPRDGSPTIHVNVRTIRSSKQTEFERMMEEHEEETKQATAQEDGGLHGSTKYDLTPVTTYEYDVVACADYVEDMGCWVRNMPQAIKDANPDFVPT